jgi:hypothetical protein
MHSETRAECVAPIVKALEKFPENHPEFNAFLICSLVDLKAVESAPVIESAFAANCVEIFITGDWNDIQVDLGLKSPDELPSKENRLFEEILMSSRSMTTSTRFSQPSKANKKAKRKQAEKSRKQNRKKK